MHLPFFAYDATPLNVILNDDVITVYGYLWVTGTCIWCIVALATLFKVNIRAISIEFETVKQ